MKKSIIFSFLTATIVIVFSGCREPSKPVLSSTETTFIFTATGGPQTFEVKSNVHWTIIGQPVGWLAVSPSEGNGVTPVTITVEPNTNTGVRESGAEFKIVAASKELNDIPLKVTQAAATSVSLNLQTIGGVTPPVAGAQPSFVVAETSQYAGTIAWTPPFNGVFGAEQEYAATITLTPKAGFTFMDVAENSFTVPGATPPVTNAANSGVVKANFPPTAKTIDIAATGVIAPAMGATPVREIDTEQYTGEVAWTPAVTDVFAAGTAYAANITLTPKTGFTLYGVAANFFTAGATGEATHAANAGAITATYPATATFSYTISATPSPITFGSLTAPYTPPAAQTITITRTGTGDVTLQQPAATNFAIGNLTRTTLTVANPTATFTVRPEPLLAVGAHNETITVSGSNGASATVDVSFTVTAAPTYTISATPSPIAFGSLQSPYTQPAAQTVTVTNTGNQPITLTPPAASNYFIGTLSTNTLAANGATATFTVRPLANLTAGTYNQTITVSGNNGASATVNVTFAVTAPTLTLSAATLNLPSAAANVDANFNITCSADWTLSLGTGGAWCNADRTSGTGNATVRLTTSGINTGNAARSFTLTVTSHGYNQTMTVTQPAATLTINSGVTSLTFPTGAANAQASFGITCDGTWNINMGSGTWCSASPTTGDYNGNVTLTATQANTTPSSRSFTLSVTAGAVTRNITVNQPSTAPSISSFSPAAAGFDATVTIVGSNFSTTPANNTVRFNGVAATVLTASATQLTVRVPKNTNCTGNITVVVDGMTATSSSQFTYELTYTVSTLAGTNVAGNANETGAAARFNMPMGLTIYNNNIYVAERNNNCIRMVTPAGVVSTAFATNPSSGTSITYPLDIIMTGPGAGYAVQHTNTILYMNGNTYSIIAGSNNVDGYVNSNGTVARFSMPHGVVLIGNNLYIADYFNHCIRRVLTASPYNVDTFAGALPPGEEGSTDGYESVARFFYPTAITVDASGYFYVADHSNNAIRKITPVGVVSTLATVTWPNTLCVDSQGNIYVGNNSQIFKVTSAGIVTVIAGGSTTGYTSGVTTGTNARFNNISGLAINSAGNILYVSDTYNHCIRQILIE